MRGTHILLVVSPSSRLAIYTSSVVSVNSVHSIARGVLSVNECKRRDIGIVNHTLRYINNTHRECLYDNDDPGGLFQVCY